MAAAEERIRAVCIHESGHAVFAEHIGLEVSSVWVQSNPLKGQTEYRGRLKAIRDDVSVTMAGPVGEILFAEVVGVDPFGKTHGKKADWARIQDNLSQLPANERGPLFERCLAETRQLLTRHQRKVKRLAQALANAPAVAGRRQLDGDEIYRILGTEGENVSTRIDFDTVPYHLKGLLKSERLPHNNFERNYLNQWLNQCEDDRRARLAGTGSLHRSTTLAISPAAADEPPVVSARKQAMLDLLDAPARLRSLPQQTSLAIQHALNPAGD